MILTTLVSLAGVCTILWLLLWTHIRWKKVLHNQQPEEWIKNIWKFLAILTGIFIFASTIFYFVGV